MKLKLLIPLIALTVSGVAQASADNKTVEQGTIAFSTHDLHCDIRPGYHANKPQVATISAAGYIHENGAKIELKHEQLYQAGCDIKALTKLAKKSGEYYGFIYGAKLTVTKDLSMNKGACVLDEKVLVDLGEGVVLQDSNREVVKLERCNE